MGKIKWVKVDKGVQCYSHDTRKHGVKFDRYFRGRYKVAGKTTTIGFGWEAEWIAGERARIKQSGEKVLRISFLDYCKGELSRFKENARRGTGPTNPTEERELAQARAETEKQVREEEDKQALTFADYFKDTYSPAAEISKKKNSSKQEQSYYKVWLKSNIGHIRLIDIRPLHLEKVKRAMVKKEKAPRTIQAVLALARQVWNHARNNDIVNGDWPGRSVKIGKFDNRRMRFLTYEETDRLLAKFKEVSPQVHNMALLSLDTGMRAGEIFSLTWENVNMDAGQIKAMDTKGGVNRTVYMTERVKTMLQGLPEGGRLVFPSRTGEEIGQISNTAERAIEAIGLNDGVVDSRNKATFHSLRHTFASRLVENGTDLIVVQRLMGHSTLAMTERYSHVRNENLQSAVRQMEKATNRAAAKKNKVVNLKK